MKEHFRTICVQLVRIYLNKNHSENEKSSQETNKPDTTSIHNEYLTSKEMVEKLKEQKEKLDHKDDQLFFSSSTAIRL